MAYYDNFADFIQKYEEGAEKMNLVAPSHKYQPMRLVTDEEEENNECIT